MCLNTLDSFNKAIISLRPETGRLIKYGFPDTFIPHLHIISQEVRSCDWQSTWQTWNWGLSVDQSINMAKAMEHDIAGKSGLKVWLLFLFYGYSLNNTQVEQSMEWKVPFYFILTFLVAIFGIFLCILMLFFYDVPLTNHFLISALTYHNSCLCKCCLV